MEGLHDLMHRLAPWVGPAVAVALILAIPWVMGWIALGMSR